MSAALRLKTGPLVPAAPRMPGAAAWAADANSAPSETAAPYTAFMSKDVDLLARIAALLGPAGFGLRVDLRGGRGADVDLGHHAAEVLGIVGEMIELRGVEIELLTGRIAG